MASEASSTPDMETLKTSLKSQLETLFAKQNLAQDAYLLSQMNAQMYIPIAAVVNAPSVQSLGADASVVLEVAKTCSFLSVDEAAQAVKPNIKVERNTILLREISSSTKEEEIRALFEGTPNGKKIVSIRPDLADTWFVTFETEAVTVEVALWLRSQTFQGKPVRAGIKSESLFSRSFFPMPSSAAPAADGSAQPMSQFMPMMNQPFYRMPYPGAPAAGLPPQHWNKMGSGFYGLPGQNNAGAPAQNASHPQNGERPPKSRRGDNNAEGGHGGRRGGRDNRRDSNRNNRPRTQSVEKLASHIGSPALHSVRLSVQLSSENFPPLPSKSDKPGASGGYDGKFRKYSKKEVLEVFRNGGVPAMPEPLQALLSQGNVPIILTQPVHSLECLAPSSRKNTITDSPATGPAPAPVDAAPAPETAKPSEAAPRTAASIVASGVPKSAPKKEEKKEEKKSQTPQKPKESAAAAAPAPKEAAAPAPAPSSASSSSAAAPAPAPAASSSSSKQTPTYAEMLKAKNAAAAAAAAAAAGSSSSSN